RRHIGTRWRRGGDSGCGRSRHAVVVTAHCLAVDDAVIARTAIEANLIASLTSDDAEVVVLDLVQPQWPAGRLRRLGWQTGGDKASGKDTHGDAALFDSGRHRLEQGPHCPKRTPCAGAGNSAAWPWRGFPLRVALLGFSAAPASLTKGKGAGNPCGFR